MVISPASPSSGAPPAGDSHEEFPYVEDSASLRHTAVPVPPRFSRDVYRCLGLSVGELALPLLIAGLRWLVLRAGSRIWMVARC